MITPTMTLEGDDNPPVLEEQSFKTGLNIYTASRCGNYHDRNEDRILFNEFFYGLADGVGGGSMGDVAAESLLNFLAATTIDYTPKSILANIKQSDNVVKKALSDHGGKRGAATLVAAWLNSEGQGYYTCVGDARIYLIETLDDSVSIRQLTIDQTYENMSSSSVEGVRLDDPARMVGVGAVGDPPVDTIMLKHHQGLLFCSDGLHKFLDDNTIAEICAMHLLPNGANHNSLYAISDALVNAALDNLSHDDTSVMIVFNHNPALLESPPSTIEASTDFHDKRYNCFPHLNVLRLITLIVLMVVTLVLLFLSNKLILNNFL